MNNGFIKPFALNLVRLGVSVILLWGMFLFRPLKTTIAKEDYGRFFLCALTGIALNQLLFLKGLSLTYSIHASLLMLGTPIFITIIAALFLNEGFTRGKLAGLALGIAGTVTLIFSRESTHLAANPLWGDTLVFINAVSYAVYFILVKPLMKKYEAVMVIRTVFTIGLFLIFPFCLSEFNTVNWSNYTGVAYLNLALVVIGGTFLAYIFNVYGIKILGASLAGTYIYLQPVFTAIIAVVFLHEELTIYKVLAALLIAAGVFLANKSSRNA